MPIYVRNIDDYVNVLSKYTIKTDRACKFIKYVITEV